MMLGNGHICGQTSHIKNKTPAWFTFVHLYFMLLEVLHVGS